MLVLIFSENAKFVHISVIAVEERIEMVYKKTGL
jgi:hypothetical protein